MRLLRYRRPCFGRPPATTQPGLSRTRSAGGTRGLRIAFLPAGNEDAASSRMRVYALARALRKEGVDVRLGGEAETDVLVVQKRVTRGILGVARRARDCGTIVCYDVDDLGEALWWWTPLWPHRRTAWKAQEGGVQLEWSAGHVVAFDGQRPAPEWFPLRHYVVLSRAHAVEKYVCKRFDAAEVTRGWHRWRSQLTEEAIAFPPAAEMRVHVTDAELDGSEPRREEYFAQLVRAYAEKR